MSAPPVSIVVPVGGVDQYFTDQLDAIRSQRTSRELEVVLAANRAVPAVEQAVAAIAWPEHWAVRTVDASAVPGPSHARNTGWRSARHDIVLFCDADDLLDEDWAETMARAVEASGACGGRLEYARLNPAALAARVTTSSHALPVKFRHLPFTASCALGVRRDLLVAVDGFDESLACGEDVDLSWRLAALGVSLGFARDAVVHYRLRADPRAAFRQALRYAADDAVLLRRHRSAGARWGVSDTLREWAATVKALAVAPSGPEARLTAATRLGAACGRAVGSVRHRAYAL
jgi:GT2 family glycosyltransferase